MTPWTLIRDLRDGHPALDAGSVQVWLEDGALVVVADGSVEFELPEPLLDGLKLAHAEWERERT